MGLSASVAFILLARFTFFEPQRELGDNIRECIETHDLNRVTLLAEMGIVGSVVYLMTGYVFYSQE